MSIEAINELNENLKAVTKLKKEVEQKDKPWVVNYIGESRDKNFNIYRYKVATWGTKWWIKNRYINQIWSWVEWTQFSDVNWYPLNKNWFKAWEVVYLRVPKKKIKKWVETLDPTPEMSTKEIMSLSNKDIIELVKKVKNDREKFFNHKDKNWPYAIINGKKVYLCDNNHLPNHNWAYIRFEFKRTGYFSLFTKKWNDYQWVYYNDGDRYDNKKIYKWRLTFNNDKEFGVSLSWV